MGAAPTEPPVDATDAPVVGERTDPSWEESYDLGMALLSEGNYEGAIRAFDDAIASAPDQPLPYTGRGRAYLLSDDTEAALKDFDAAVTLDGTVEEAWLGAAAAYFRQGNDEKAKEVLQAASDQNPGFSDIYEMILNSVVYMATGGGMTDGDLVAPGFGMYCDADRNGTKDWIVNLGSGTLPLTMIMCKA